MSRVCLRERVLKVDGLENEIRKKEYKPLCLLKLYFQGNSYTPNVIKCRPSLLLSLFRYKCTKTYSCFYKGIFQQFSKNQDICE